MRFNQPPGWPPPPPGFVPGPSWRPDPRWPPPPAGWQLWVPDQDERDAGLTPGYATYRGQSPSASPHSHRRSAAAPGTTQLTASPWRPEPPPPQGTSGMAIAAFVLGLLGVAILGVIFGVAALRRIGRTRQGGKGLAIAGIVLSIAWIAVIAVVVAVVGAAGLGNPAPRPPGVAASSSSPAGSQTVDLFSLVTGDCFDNPAVTSGQTQNVTTVVQTPCSKPHNAQIFATFNVSGGILSYPGSAKLVSLASTGCDARVRPSLDGTKLTQAMTIRFLYPLQSSWLAGHRTISCIVYNPTPTLTSSLLKS